jgi:hypothetical protein
MQLGYKVLGLTGFHQDRRHPRAVGAFVDVGRPIGGHCYHGNAASACLHAEVGGEREAVAAGERDVGYDHVGHEFERARICVLGRFALGHAEAPALEELGVAFARERIVFD